MIKKINSKDLYLAEHEWLKSRFHFSFGEYYDTSNINYGVLRVLNDDIIEPNNGFDTHPHKNMEIITYIIKGKLTHQDSMDNKRELFRGEVQYMSAGTGIFHSEHNFGSEKLRLFQLWIYPDKENYKPNYGDYNFEWKSRENRFLHMVSSKYSNAPIKINQDVNIYSAFLSKKQVFKINKNRQVYLVVAEGQANINGETVKTRDAVKADETLNIIPEDNIHILLVEMKKD